MARQPQKVPTVDEIQEIIRRRQAGEPWKTSAEQVMEKEKPTPTRARVVRIANPPVSLIPQDQTPPKTLSTVDKRKSVTDILAEFGLDPIDELLSMYNERIEDPESPDYGKFVMSRAERVSLMKEIMKYQHPTLKAVEHKGSTDDRSITVVLMMPGGDRVEQKVEQRGKAIDV